MVGKPIIATGWSGHTDFLDPKLAAMIGGKVSPIHPSAQQKDMLIEGSQWFEPDHNHIGYFINDVKKNYKTWKQKAKSLQSKNKKSFSFEAMGEQIDSILEQYLPEIPKTVKIDLPQMSLPKLEKI